MTVTKRVLALLLTIVVGSYFIWDNADERGVQLFQKVGVQSYALHYDQKIFNFLLSITPHPTFVHLDAIFSMDVKAFDEEEVEVAIDLSDINLRLEPQNLALSETLSEYYGRSAKIILNQDGQIKRMQFAGLDENYVGYKELLRALEMIFKREMHYKVDQVDGLGQYVAAYRKDDHLLKRQKKTYTQTLENRDIIIYDAQASAQHHQRSNWFEQFDLHEKLRVLQGSQKLLQVETTISLSLVAPIQAEVTVDEDELYAMRMADTNLYESLEKEAHESYFEQNSYDLQKLLSEIIATPDARDLYVKLSRYLKLHPEEIAALYEEIERQPDKISRDLLATLEALQLEASQQLLNQVARDSSMQPMNRIRSIIALGAQEEPTPESLSNLEALLLEHDDEVSTDLSNTALLALGAVGGRSEALEHEVSAYIEEELRSADNYARAKTALLAAKNGGVRSYITFIIPYLYHDDIRLRRLSLELLLTYREEGRVLAAIEQQVTQEEDDLLREAFEAALQ